MEKGEQMKNKDSHIFLQDLINSVYVSWRFQAVKFCISGTNECNSSEHLPFFTVGKWLYGEK